MKKRNKIIISLIIGAVVLVASYLLIQELRETEEENIVSKPIVLPMDVWPGNFWVYVAEQKGLFKEAGLNVVVEDVTDTYSIDDIISGAVDAYVVSVFDVIQANAQNNADLVVVMYVDNSVGAEGIVAKPGINAVKDLSGKRVGVEMGGYLDFNLDVAITNAGMTDKDITKVDYATLDLAQAYAKNKIDAAVIWEPDLSRIIEEYGGNKIFDTSMIKGLSPGVLVFKKSFIEERSGDVQKITDVWLKATEWIKANMDETIQMISKIDFEDIEGPSYYSTEELKQLLDQDLLTDMDDSLLAFSYAPGFDSLYGNAQYVARFLQKRGMVGVLPDIEPMFDSRFIFQLSE